MDADFEHTGDFTMRNGLFFGFFSCASVLLMGCSHDGIRALSSHSATYPDKPAVRNFRYSWALPKTTFDVDATWTFKGCEMVQGTPLVDAKVDIQITAHAVPDPALGLVFLDAAASNSFWQDHVFDVKTATGSHLLQSFNSTAVDQTGVILGNILNGLVKVADIAALSVASSGRPVPPSPSCGPASQEKNDIVTKQKQLQGMSDQTTDQAKKLIAEISSLQQHLVIKLDTVTVDPGVDPRTQKSVPILKGLVGTLKMPQDKLEKSGWLVSPNKIDGHFDLSINLDCSKASPPEFANDNIQPVPLLRDALWREVAYIPVVISNQEGAMVVKPTTLPFAQFGASRTLPLDAPAFGKADWAITFSEFGEVTEAKWGSQATGTGVSQLFLGSLSASSSIATDLTKAAPTDKKTQDLQAENAQLQAIMDNATKKQQCRDLKAKGQVESCP